MDHPILTRQIDANGLSFTIDEAGDGDDVALLLHGFPESRLSWRKQLPALAALGWRAVAPDLRGYGASSRPKDRDAYHIDHLMADVGALFDVLGARRRLLVAHDWGGVIAWAFAQDRVRPLDGLVVLNAPHPGVYADILRRSPRQALRSWYVLFFQLPGLPEAMLTANHARALGDAFRRTAVDPAAFTDAAIAAYRDNAAIPGAMTAMINYYRANTRVLQRWAGGGLRPIETPTLLVWGERDPFLDAGLVSAHAAVASHLAVHSLPQASHWVQQEAADAVNAAMAAWMRDQGLAGRT